MSDYSEILKLPYKIEEINKLLKKLVQDVRIKPLNLLEFDIERNTFQLIEEDSKKIMINITVEELENGYTKIEISSKTKGLVFVKDKKIVRKIVNLILSELNNIKIKDSNSFSFEIIKIKNRSKKIMAKLLLFVLLIVVLIIIISVMDTIINNVSYYESVIDADNYGRFFRILLIFIVILYPILIKTKGKYSINKRKNYLNNKLNNLFIEKEKNNISLNQKNGEKVNNNQTNNKLLNYISNLSQDQIKRFMIWFFSICTFLAIIIAVSSALSGSSNQILEGTYIQQLGSYNGPCAAIPDEITFKNGLVYGSGAESGYLDKKYEYKINGEKIYILVNGQEVFSELTIKNKNTLVYGDGVFDEQYIYGNTVKVCGVNGDGIYLKQY